jgi:NAD(P)-dependent dehydrogenase (short-subunit alcohol dehydrogenase family)
MLNKLDGKVVVVTGSTRGFGFAIAQELLQAGAKVVVSGRSQANVDRAVNELRMPGKVVGFACDVSKPEDVNRLASKAIQWGKQIDIWINNAGYAPQAGGIVDFPPEQAVQTVNTNCLGCYYGSQTALAVMQPTKGAVLVNIYGRGSDLKPASPSGLYGATKAWITSFTRTLASECKSSGIKIIGYSPGMMLTDMLVVDTVIGEQVKETMKNMPMVLKVLAKPPALPAADLVKLLETNEKEFVECHFVRGWRLVSMVRSLMWMSINPKARPAPQDYPSVPAYRPPIEI